uniref:Uncharacterized protein n=1 Tax=Schizaphis graminum TaxID=13262 RepID=A0A2S2P2Z7_SCHGA
MAKSNTPDEKLKNQTQTLQHTVFTDDYNNDKLLYPNEKLGILKRNLEIVRSMVDKSDRFKKKCSAIRRPMNNAPLHEVYKNINNKDSFSILASILEKENNVNSKYTK